MTPVPLVRARDLVRALHRLGFEHVRSKGSHHRFAHPDGRRTTVPIHAGRDLPRGLLRKIVVEDLGIEMEELQKYL